MRVTASILAPQHGGQRAEVKPSTSNRLRPRKLRCHRSLASQLLLC